MAQAQQQQQGGGGGDSAYGAVWIAVLVILTGAAIWYQFHAAITSLIFTIKLFQARFISLFVSSIDPTMTVIETVDPKLVTWSLVDEISAIVGDYMRWPISAVLLICAVLLYFSNPLNRFRKTYSMDTLAGQERENWAQISPVLKLDLVNQPIDEGPWAMAMPPMLFAQKHNLIKRNPRIRHIDPSPFAPSPVMLVRSEAKKIFSLQMGAYWQGPESVPPHVRALFAIFAAKINRDRDGSSQLIRQINESTFSGKIDFSGHMDLLRKHYNTKLVVAILQRHAYVYTVMGAMLIKSRDDGVMATADFLWLKPIDRPLWYMLNCMGRQTPYVETAGPFAHYLAEKELGHRVMVPVIDEAVNALEIAIKEIKLTHEELVKLTAHAEGD